MAGRWRDEGAEEAGPPRQDTSQSANQLDRTGYWFAAYFELTDAADWIRPQLGGPLDAFMVTIHEFRLLCTLYAEGPMSMSEAAKKRGWQMQNLLRMVDRTEG